ncbi:MAG: porin family protein [Prevotella sp.]|nr:porin family protein [Prevotella sp.]
MKKIFVMMTVACMAFAMPSQAQVKFGLKGGLNLTAITTDGNSDGISNKAGFFAGPTVKFTLPVVGLSVDGSALYDQRNAKIKGTDQTLKVQSIQIPINVRYGVGLSSIVNVFAFAGPQFGFNIGDKTKLLDDMSTWKLKSSSISGNVGIGATVFSKLQITANYNFQLSKTSEVEYQIGGNTESGKLNFNSWQLGLGYFF